MVKKERESPLKYFLISACHILIMRIFIFLSVFYAIIIAFGITTSYAQRGGACSDAECGQQQTADEATILDSVNNAIGADGEIDVDGLSAKLEALLAAIQEKIGPEKINDLIQNAVKTNPQIAQLVKLAQEYGVLTDIELDNSMTEPSGEGE